MKNLYIICYLLIANISYSQASWSGKFYFNLSKSNGELINSNEILNKKVKLYSFNARKEKIKYDIINKSFVYHSHFITENRSFYVITEKDTMKIELPIIKNKYLYITRPIQIKKKVVSFYSPVIIDMMLSNESSDCVNNNEIFYLKNPVIIDDWDDKERLHFKKYFNELLLVPFIEE